MSGANSFKFVLLPPQSDTTRDWAKRLAKIVSEARVLVIGGGSDRRELSGAVRPCPRFPQRRSFLIIASLYTSAAVWEHPTS